MMEYIFIFLFGFIILLSYIFINKPSIISRVFLRNKVDYSKRRKIYLEQFREQKQSRMDRNIIIQALPWLGVLALVFILGNQYFVLATVLSGSMVPTFEKGDLVLMQTFDLDINVGDIVMFPMYGIKEPITHRIVAKDEKGNIITKGDANKNTDGSGFPPERVAGKAVLIGNKPIVLKGLGYAIRPENIGEVTVLAKLPKTFVMAQAFSQFRTVQPLIIFFGTIFYFFLLLESRMNAKRKFNNNKKCIYGAGKIQKIK